MRTEVVLALSVHAETAANEEGKRREAGLINELILNTAALKEKYGLREIPESPAGLQYVIKKDFIFDTASLGIEHAPVLNNTYDITISELPVTELHKKEVRTELDTVAASGQYDMGNMGLYLTVHFENGKFSNLFKGATLAKFVNAFEIRPLEINLISCNAGRGNAEPIYDFLDQLEFDPDNPPEIHAYHYPVYVNFNDDPETEHGAKLFKPLRQHGEEAIPKIKLTNEQLERYKKIFRYDKQKNNGTKLGRRRKKLLMTRRAKSKSFH